MLQRLSFTVSYEDGMCQIQEIPQKNLRTAKLKKASKKDEMSRGGYERIADRNKSIAEHQLSEIVMNCQNSNIILISEPDYENSLQRRRHKESKILRNKLFSQLNNPPNPSQNHQPMQRSSSQVLIGADAIAAANLVNPLQ